MLFELLFFALSFFLAFQFSPSVLVAQTCSSPELVENISYSTLVEISLRAKEEKDVPTCQFMDLYKAGKVFIFQDENGQYKALIIDGGGCGTTIIISDL